MPMNLRLLIIIFLQSIIHSNLVGQAYEGHPCTEGDKSLIQLLQKKELKYKSPGLFISDCDPDRGQMVTSFLKASGKAPAKGVADDPDGNAAYDTWTCLYAGGSAADGNNATAWVEGVAGSGKGEAVVITLLNLSKKLEIWGGYGKSQSLYTANNRPKSINVHIIRAHPQEGGASQCGYWYDELKVVASKMVTLRDVNQFQPLAIPAFKKETYLFQNEQWDYQYWLMVELVDVYPGTKYQDTCITEIRNAI